MTQRTLQLLCFTLLGILLLAPLTSQATTIKLATISPEGSSWMVAMRQAGKDIEKATQGRVKLKFYPGGVMGSDQAVLRKIRIGQLQGGAFSGGALASFYPDSQVYNLPLEFQSFDEVDYVRSRMDQTIIDGLDKGGLVTFGLAEGGLAYMMTNQPVRSLAELRQQKIWIPSDDPGSLQAAKAFELSTIPLSIADVLASLQTGLINTVTASPIAAIALQWHTQVKYVTDVPLLYFYATMAIDKKVFMRLSKADQQVVTDALSNTFKQIDQQNRKDNVAAMQALQQQGISIVAPSTQQLGEWRDAARKAINNILGSGQLSNKTVATLEQHLKDYRSSEDQAMRPTMATDQIVQTRKNVQ